MKSMGPKIWTVEQAFKVPFFGNIGSRMTVIQLKNGELMLISPVAFSPKIGQELDTLGPVRYLIGPNSTHHLSLQKYQEVYPTAQLCGPRKLQKKRFDLPFQITLEEGGQYPWSEEVGMLLINSPKKMCEAVFFHQPIRSLIVTDLLFNLPQAKSLIQKWAYRLNGIENRPVMTKMGRSIWKDSSHLKEKIKTISHWDFDQIVLAHGETVPNNGKQKFLDSFSWLQ